MLTFNANNFKNKKTKYNKIKIKQKNNVNSRNSWNVISVSGTDGEVINYLQKNNILKIKNLEKMYFRLQNKTFYEQCRAIFDEKGLFHEIIHSYCLKHKNKSHICEWICYQTIHQNKNEFLNPFFMIYDFNKHGLITYDDRQQVMHNTFLCVFFAKKNANSIKIKSKV